MQMKNRFFVINQLQVTNQPLSTIIDVEDFRSIRYYLNTPVSFYFIFDLNTWKLIEHFKLTIFIYWKKIIISEKFFPGHRIFYQL